MTLKHCFFLLIFIYYNFLCPIVGKTRKVTLDEKFFTGYRKTILEPSEVLIDILVPFTKKVSKITLLIKNNNL